MDKFNSTIIQPFEVVRYGLVDTHTDAIRYCNIIATKEEALFRECFGLKFYSDMLSDLQSYTYTDYQFQVVYTVGDYVLFDGVIYECIQDTTGSEPPSNGDFWSEAPKFLNVEYNYIWKRYLSKILSWSVIKSQTAYSAIKDTNKGLVRNNGDDFDPATLKEMSVIKKEYQGDVRTTIQNMEAYILENKDNAAFANYKAVKDICHNDNCSAKRPDYFGFNLDSDSYNHKSNNYPYGY